MPSDPTVLVTGATGFVGTEVVVTDHSIREVVPGEPIAYAEAVRRALAES